MKSLILFVLFVSVTDDSGRELRQAAKVGDMVRVAELIKSEADVDSAGDDGDGYAMTPLLWGVPYRHTRRWSAACSTPALPQTSLQTSTERL